MTPIAVVGAGSWGTTLALLLAVNRKPVRLLVRDQAKARVLATTRLNEAYLPGVLLPDGVAVEAGGAALASGAEIVVVAVPSASLDEVAADLGRLEPRPRIVVSASKGLGRETLQTASQLFRAALPPAVAVAVISGPNLAREIAAGQPAAGVIACERSEAARELQGLFTGESFRAYTSTDVLGVELAGALKNVIALAVGMTNELGLGANAQASLVTRGLAEMARLGAALGAQAETFRGLAGMGDLMATCSSALSRNLRAGRLAARGIAPDGIRSAIGQAVEGLDSTVAAVRLAERHRVEMPIAREVYRVLFEGKAPAEAARALMRRPPAAEHGETGIS